jgi:hypothetical protein
MLPDEILLEHLTTLKRLILSNLSMQLIILHARLLMRLCDRSVLPDWVEILANGDPSSFEAVIDVARDDILEEGKHVISETSVL